MVTFLKIRYTYETPAQSQTAAPSRPPYTWFHLSGVCWDVEDIWDAHSC